MKKWISTHKIDYGSRYWYCPSKCGAPHTEIGLTTCYACGLQYTVLQIQGPKVLIEVKDEN